MFFVFISLNCYAHIKMYTIDLLLIFGLSFQIHKINLNALLILALRIDISMKNFRFVIMLCFCLLQYYIVKCQKVIISKMLNLQNNTISAHVSNSEGLLLQI